jgi:hypothetical protein
MINTQYSIQVTRQIEDKIKVLRLLSKISENPAEITQLKKRLLT